MEIGIHLRGRRATASPLRVPSGKEEIEALLRHEQAFAAPFFKFLETPYYARSRWRLTGNDSSSGLYMEAPIDGGTPSIYFQGDADATQEMLNHLDIPRYSYLSCFDHQLPVLNQHFFMKSLQHLSRMRVSGQTFSGVQTSRAVSVGADRLSSINDLYGVDSGAWVTFRQVSDGIYYGIWDEGRLVSIAGTQSSSRPYGIAMVANVLTHPAYRGLGYATECVGALTQRLLEDLDMVVLNVDPKNSSAMHVYQKLGYQEAGAMAEAWAVWKGRHWWDKVLATIYSFMPD